MSKATDQQKEAEKESPCTEAIRDDRSACTAMIKHRQTVRTESRGNWKEIKQKKRERGKKQINSLEDGGK